MVKIDFESSSLWQSAFGERTNDLHKAARNALKQKLLDLRAKVEIVVNQITKDIPSLTVHDLTHLDALWETASLIAGPTCAINPAEAYVFGAAILLHDAGMCLVAYPNGIADLHPTPEWRDIVTSLLQQSESTDVSEEMLRKPPDQILRVAVGETLRVLHAQRARELPFLKWRDQSGNSEPLIEDINLRSFYGPIIGKIAHSHHVSVGHLSTLLGSRLGAYAEYPSEWTVDPIVLACLLRCADAAHIDERRAPRFLMTLIRPTGKSAEHWTFQSKLAKARLEADALIYTSGPEFGLDDAEAWWLCFDTIRMIDSELSGVDILLENVARNRFAARRVRGSESPEALAEYVRTKGWTPVDTQLRVSDVPRLVRLFGGAHLYGNNLRVPIRELVQNSSDAIRARRLLQGFNADYGTVEVRIRKSLDEYWLEVEDDGLGMSDRTMTVSLLDFGRSYWSSDAVKLEFPGLIAKGMTPTGRFGVGFFSVFMLGDFVRVTSSRFDSAFALSKTLEFRSGLEMRPILRDAFPSEYLQKGGTRVSVRLNNNPYNEGGLLAESDWLGDIYKISLRVILGQLCPNMDVKLTTDEGNAVSACSTPNDWVTMDGKELLARLESIQDDNEKKRVAVYGQQMRILAEPNEKIAGRACILGTVGYTSDQYGCVTVGGLTATRLIGIGGVLLGEPETIARDSAMPIVSAETLSKWATEQARLLSKAPISSASKLNALAFVLLCGGDPADLPIICRGSEFLNIEQFRNELSTENSISIFSGDEVDYDEDYDACHPRDFKEYFESNGTVFFIREVMPSILIVGSRKWPQCITEAAFPDRPKSYEELVRNIVTEEWGEDFRESTNEEEVGDVNGSPIRRSVTTYTRA